MPTDLDLDYLVEARSTLDSYIEGGNFSDPESRRMVMDSVAYSLLSIAESLHRIVAEEAP